MADFDQPILPRPDLAATNLEGYAVARNPQDELLRAALPLINQLDGLLPTAHYSAGVQLDPTILNALRKVADQLVKIGSGASDLQFAAADRQSKVPSPWVWQDGKFHPWSQATVPLDTHSLHYGTAVFEGIRCYNTDRGPAVFRLDEHIDRLFYSAKTMGIWDEVGYQREVKQLCGERGNVGILRRALLEIQDRDLQLQVLAYGIATLADSDTPPQTVAELQERVAERSGQLRKLAWMPYSREQVKEAICATIRANGQTECYIRPVVYFGSKLGLDVQGAKPHLAILTLAWDKGHGSEYKVWQSSVQRNSSRAIDPHAKVAGNYVNSVLAKLSVPPGYQGALLFDANDCVAEGPGENLFLVMNGELRTPPSSDILPGITRHTILQIAARLGIQVQVRNLLVDDLRKASEAFFVGTAAEVTPISGFSRPALNQRHFPTPQLEGSEYLALDREEGRRFRAESTTPEYCPFSGERPITARIQAAFSDVVRGRMEGFESWLTPIKHSPA